ncbi:MAG TPA: helix-turn-helix domain-containing protein [Acidimicrobiales bacterium]|nr:helix-turn-helix domain-containing protein [Acidimicrobiales bacterium]
MKRTDTSGWPCNIARGAHVLGDHWNLLLIRQACLGSRRFEEFQRTLGIGRNILTLRLDGLVDEGILDRVEYQQRPRRCEYRLTERGRDAYTVLVAMAAWAERWMTGPEGTPVLQHHVTCGHDMHAVVVCSECAEPIDVREVRVRPGPGSIDAPPTARAGPSPSTPRR